MRRQFTYLLASLLLLSCSPGRAIAQAPPSDQLQVGPPARRVIQPSATASAEELERRADELRGEKAYLDAIDYFKAALKKNPNSSQIYNKLGIVQLQTYHLKDAKKAFEKAIKLDRKNSDAHNNLGVVHYELKNYGKAVKLYGEAIELNQTMASYYSNLGAAFFSQKQYQKASLAYSQALQLDPEIFERTSRIGVAAQLPSPEDRARYDYVMARLYAKIGMAERSLQYLRRAMEEGYKDIRAVYKDAEFTELRKDPRFTALMTSKPVPIPE